MTKNGMIIFMLIILLVGGGAFIVSKQKQSRMQKAPTPANQVSPEATDTTGKTSEIADPVETLKEVSEIALTVASPVSGAHIATPKATIKGRTTPKAEVFANEAEGIADSTGNFSLSVVLDEGENSIIVTAVDANGKVAEKEIIVTYDTGE